MKPSAFFLAAASAFGASAAPPAADVHCHFTTPAYLAALEKHGAAMDEFYPVPVWSPEALASFLDEAGIGFAVLTSVAPQPHFGDAAESVALCRSMNDEAARLAAADPKRLAWCATLPLPSVDEAVAEAVRALARLFARNVPARYPRVKFIVPHAGSFLPLALPRMKAVHPIVRAKSLAGEIDWDANLRSLWFDLAGAPTVESVRRLLTLTTPDRILYGSDFPYAPAPARAAGLAKLRAELAADPDLAPHAESILGGNAQKLFHSELQSRRESLAQSPQSPQSGNETSRTSRTSREESNAAIYRIAEINAALPPDVFRKVQPPK